MQHSQLMFVLLLCSATTMACSESQKATPAPKTANDTQQNNAKAANADAKSKSDKTASKATDEAEAPDVELITITGVALEPAIAEACRIATPDVFFEFDSAKLSSEARGTLDAVAKCLTKGPMKGDRVRLIGHTDEQGSDAYNLELGISRAEAVANYLEKHGVAKDEVVVESYGASDALPLKRAYPFDRRVDIRRML